MGTVIAAKPASDIPLKLELFLFYLAAPVAIAVFLPASSMFTALFALSAVGLVLLQFTHGFQWRSLRANMAEVRAIETAKFALIMLFVCLGIIYLTAPDSAFGLLRRSPLMMLVIAIGYPILSVLPQELVFRPLFFRRYGGILPDGRAAIWINAALFSLAHLMYWSWIVAGMTFVGGLLFAWAYETKGSFSLAVVLHSVAGVVIFLTGMGLYFYSGNVVRPF